MTTEREAWQYIARQIKASPGMSSWIMSRMSIYNGLCAAIYDMCRRSIRDCVISERTGQSMSSKIEKMPTRTSSLYKWPLTPKGLGQRRKFCLTQARQCTRKRSNRD